MKSEKDSSNQNPEERNRMLSSDDERVNDEDNLDTRKISQQIEEGDADYDDEETENEELTEEDFKIDEEEGEDVG